VFDCFEGVQDVRVLKYMLGTKETAQQVAVVLVECKSTLFHQLTPSVEEEGPGLDYE